MATIRYEGGNGRSREEAIVIVGAKNGHEGVDAEYEYLDTQLGPRGSAWTVEGQALIQRDDRTYDRLDYKTPDGEGHQVWFDITEFFGS